MFDLEKLDESIRDERQLKALIGMGRKEFDFLTDLFSEAQLLIKEEEYQVRKEQQEKDPNIKQIRRSSKAIEPRLNTNTKKLFYLLYYLKTYPTFDVLGFSFGMPRSTAHHNLYQVIPVLKKLLETLGIAPKRAIQSIEDLKESFGLNREEILQKSGLEETGRELQWKKKCHTKKNTIIANEKQYIGYLGPTVCGTSHDYSMLKEEFLERKEVFTETNLLVDLGFLGIVKDFGVSAAGILIPEKKPRIFKNHPKNTPKPDLTKAQKESNRIISSFRIKVENSIGGAKRYGAVTQVFRNKSETLNDLVMELACSLWNMHVVF